VTSPPIPSPPQIEGSSRREKSVLRRILQWFLWAVIICVSFLAIVVATIAWLWHTGRLQALILDHGGPGARPGMAMEHPWEGNASEPVARLDSPAARRDAANLQSVDEFYSITNVWLARLHFSASEWTGLGPNRVKPVDGVFGGHGGEFPLRNPNADRNGLAGSLGYEFPWSTASVEIGGVAFDHTATRFKGNGTYVTSKKFFKRPFKVDLAHGRKGGKLAGEKVFNFANLVADHSGLSDAMSYEFFREAGVPAPRTAFARMLLTIDRKFTDRPLGLYVMVEDVDGEFLEDRFGYGTTALFKPVTYHLFDDLGGDWADYSGIYDNKTALDEDEKARVIECARFVTHASDEEFARRCGEFFDLDETARFIAVQSLLSSYDGFLNNGQNYYMYLDKTTDQFGFIPWDLDHSWGGFVYVGAEALREKSSIMHPWMGRMRLLERLFAVPEFKALYRQRIEEIFRSQFDVERLKRRVDDLAAVIRPFVHEESDYRINRFEKAVSSEWEDGLRDGIPDDPNRPVHQIKRFIENRAKSVAEQLEGKTQGETPRRR
jgi:spore coat protein CotH